MPRGVQGGQGGLPEAQGCKVGQVGNSEGQKVREGSFKIPILGQVENSEEPKVREGSLKIPILGQVENSEGPKVR